MNKQTLLFILALNDSFIKVSKFYLFGLSLPANKRMQGLLISGDPVAKVRTVGEGNFSQVYFAETKSGKIAAIKKVKKSVKDKTAYDLAKKEASILRGLKSPYVLQLIETFEEHNYFYLVEKFYHGSTLESILKKKRSLSTNDSEKFFKNILKGVEYLHSKNIVHRDLKPSNIIVNQNNEAFLIDLGFACKFQPGDEQILNERFGTPFYMSPQLLNRHLYNSTTDIWSLGVIFYEMLCGFLPYSGASDGQLYKTIMDPKTDIFKIQKYIPEGIQNVIKRCLTIEISKRMSWAELFAYGRGQTISAPKKGKGGKGEIVYEDTSICMECCRF